MFGECSGHVLRMDLACLGYVLGMSWVVCCGNVFGMFLGIVLGMSWGYKGNVLRMFGACVGNDLGLS